MGQAAASMHVLRLEVGGKGHVHVQLRASPFPKLKQWSEWEREFALSMTDRSGRGGRCAAVRWLQQHFSSRFSTLGESHIRSREKAAERKQQHAADTVKPGGAGAASWIDMKT